jgi:hypothetical protein
MTILLTKYDLVTFIKAAFVLMALVLTTFGLMTTIIQAKLIRKQVRLSKQMKMTGNKKYTSLYCNLSILCIL